jgi:hypothetical protein
VPTPSFGLHDFDAASTSFFDMGTSGYDNFMMDDMPMDFGTLTDVFNWVCKLVVCRYWISLTEQRVRCRLDPSQACISSNRKVPSTVYSGARRYFGFDRLLSLAIQVYVFVPLLLLSSVLGL